MLTFHWLPNVDNSIYSVWYPTEQATGTLAVGRVRKLYLMHRVSCSQGQKGSPMSPRALALNMNFDLEHSQQLPGATSSSFCFHLTLSPSLSWILLLSFFFFFIIGSG